MARWIRTASRAASKEVPTRPGGLFFSLLVSLRVENTSSFLGLVSLFLQFRQLYSVEGCCTSDLLLARPCPCAMSGGEG